MSVERVTAEPSLSLGTEAFGFRVTNRSPTAREAGPVLAVDALSAEIQRFSFRVGDSWCRSHAVALRTGMRLGVTACQYERSFEFSVVQPASELEFVVSKGGVLLTRTTDGEELERGGHTLQLGQARTPVALSIRAAGEDRTDSVSVTLSRDRLLELLGARELPPATRGGSRG